MDTDAEKRMLTASSSLLGIMVVCTLMSLVLGFLLQAFTKPKVLKGGVRETRAEGFEKSTLSDFQSNLTNVVVTGAAQGVGLELAAVLFSNHFDSINLVIIDIRDDLFKSARDEVQKFAIARGSEQLGHPGQGRVEFIKCDLSDENAVDNLWDEHFASEYGRIHILVNNAAMARGMLFKDMKFADYRRSIRINQESYVQMA